MIRRSTSQPQELYCTCLHTRARIFFFATSVLARHSQRPGARHWNRVKHLFQYLKGTKNLGLHYTKDGTPEVIGYVDVGFKSYENYGKSRTSYIFLKNNAPISWKSVKQTVTTTFANHSKLIAFHEATREAVWLRDMYKIIMEQCGLTQDNIVFEQCCMCRTSRSWIDQD